MKTPLETQKTLQSNIKNYKDYKSDITKYSLFLGGLNATHQALEQYDPLTTGYSRIFFLRMPYFMESIMPEETKNIRHLLEYGFTKIDGIGNIDLETEQIQGGYSGRSFDVATTSKEGTQSITISLYEFSGSPLREYIDMWITGISDPYTGLGTYHGAKKDGIIIPYNQSNHVAEAIYVVTDPTGKGSEKDIKGKTYNHIEYACLLTNMMPKSSPHNHFNYNSGEHSIVTVDLEFTCVKYQSPQINEVATLLVDRFDVLSSYLDFKSAYSETEVNSKDKTVINNWGNQNILTK